MTIDTHTLILIAVFCYFAIGALCATATAMVSYGFTGRGDPMIPVLFFAWPILLLLKVPGILFIAGGVGAALGMTWLAWLILPH